MAPNLKNLTLGEFALTKTIYGKEPLSSIIVNIYFHVNRNTDGQVGNFEVHPKAFGVVSSYNPRRDNSYPARWQFTQCG
jgi:hypothetical protein